jgi:DNA repair ATPase RecN
LLKNSNLINNLKIFKDTRDLKEDPFRDSREKCRKFRQKIIRQQDNQGNSLIKKYKEQVTGTIKSMEKLKEKIQKINKEKEELKEKNKNIAKLYTKTNRDLEAIRLIIKNRHGQAALDAIESRLSLDYGKYSIDN